MEDANSMSIDAADNVVVETISVDTNHITNATNITNITYITSDDGDGGDDARPSPIPLSSPIPSPSITSDSNSYSNNSNDSNGNDSKVMHPLEQLNIQQVQNLLEFLNLGNFKAAFVSNQVDGATLATVESASDVTDLGITLAVKAKLLFKKIMEYKASGVPSTAVSSVSYGSNPSTPQPRTTSSLEPTPIANIESTDSQLGTSSNVSGLVATSQALPSPMPQFVESSSEIIVNPPLPLPSALVDISPIESSLIERVRRAKSFSVISAVLQHALCRTSPHLAIAVFEALLRITKAGPTMLGSINVVPSRNSPKTSVVVDEVGWSVLEPEPHDDSALHMHNFLSVVPDIWKHFVDIAEAMTTSELVAVSFLNTTREIYKSVAAASATSSGSNQSLTNPGTWLLSTLISDGLIKVVVCILRVHGLQSSDVVENSLPLLNMISVNNAANRLAIVTVSSNDVVDGDNGSEYDSCLFLLKVIRLHGLNSEIIAESGLRVIINLALSADVRTILATAGACELVIELLSKFSPIGATGINVNVAQAGCKAVNNLSYLNTANSGRFIIGGIVNIIVSILNTIDITPSKFPLAIASLQVISGLCYDNNDVVQSFLGVGVVPAIERISDLFIDTNLPPSETSNASFVASFKLAGECAAAALDVLSGEEHDDDDDLSEDGNAVPEVNEDKVLESHVSTTKSGALVEASTISPTTVPLPERVSRSHPAENSQSSSSSVITPPVDLAAVSRLVDTALSATSPATISTCLNNPIALQSEVLAIAILVSISQLCDGSAAALAEFGAIPNFFTALAYMIRAHKTSFVVAEKALSAIKFLVRYGDSVTTSNKTNAFGLGEADVCQLTVDMVMQHGVVDEEVALQGVCCIRNLTVNPQNMLRLGSAGACGTVVEIMRVHGFTNVAVAEQSLRAVVNLAISDVNRELLGTAGACAVVVELLRIHGLKHDTVAEQALGAIVNLAAVNSNRALLGSAGACALVVEVMQSHVTALYSNNEIAKQGSLAVLNLTWNNSANARMFQNADARAMLQLLVLDNMSVTNEVAKKNAREAINKLSSSASVMSMFKF